MNKFKNGHILVFGITKTIPVIHSLPKLSTQLFNNCSTVGSLFTLHGNPFLPVPKTHWSLRND